MSIDWPAHARRVIERLGVPAMFTHQGSGAVDVTGIFRRGYAESLGVAGSDPSFTAMTADLTPAVAQGDLLTVAGGDYVVRNPEPDAVAGQTRLPLRLA